MTADIEAIRARLTESMPLGEAFEIIIDLCDEVEALRQTLLQRTAERDFHITEVDELSSKLEDFTEAASGARAELDDHGRQLGYALVKEIRRRELADDRYDLAFHVGCDIGDKLTSAWDREAELTADLYELRQQRREAAEVAR